MRRRRPLLSDLLIGAAAGAAATWLMDRATTALLERESEEAKRRENEARGDRTAYEIAAERGAGLLGRELSDEERARAGTALHWTLGVVAGIKYAAFRRMLSVSGPLAGLGYGTLFWLAIDEGGLTLAGLTPPPNQFPWETHVRGLVGHLVYGVSLEAAFSAADRLK